MARTKNAKVPEVGSEVPEFNLSSAQGGSLRLGMRTATGPVIVAFFRGVWSEEDVAFFKKLAAKEDEINLAIGDVVGVGVAEAGAAREFVKATGMKSHILYDYAKVATPAWGLLEKDKEHGEYARPATFLIDTDNKVVEAWMDERPNPDELLAKITGITGLPKEPEEEDEGEKPKKGATKKADDEGASDAADSSEGSEEPKREKLSPEEREKRRAERKAARESDGEAKPAAEEEKRPEAEGKAEAKPAAADKEEKPKSEAKGGDGTGSGDPAEKSGESTEGSGQAESKPEAASGDEASGEPRGEKKEKE